jgi:hypothetical protein
VKRPPTIFRKKRGGRHYGNQLVAINGADVNLCTKSAELARKRLPEALKGKRSWPSDAELAAEASDPGIEGAAADLTGTTANQSPGQVPTPAAAAPPLPVVPDNIIPPAPAPLLLPPMSPAADAEAEAEATAAAAEQVAGGAGDAANDNAGGGSSAFNLPPEAIRGLLKQGALAIVIAQLELQGWLIKKRFGKLVQPLEGPGAQQTIDIAAQAWVAQLEAWFPDIESCPPWLLAVGAPLLLLPAQLATAVDDPDKKAEKTAETGPAQVAA